MGGPRILAVHRSSSHSFTKFGEHEVLLVEGVGVLGDAHAGTAVRHRSRMARDPNQPNLRQVHLMHRELFDQLQAQGFFVFPGDLGENLTTEGLDLLALPAGALLQMGGSAVVRVTGLRNPCAQIDRFQPGLMAAVLGRAADGTLVRKAGVMGVVVCGGAVRAGDAVQVCLPPAPHRPLEPV